MFGKKLLVQLTISFLIGQFPYHCLLVLFSLNQYLIVDFFCPTLFFTFKVQCLPFPSLIENQFKQTATKHQGVISRKSIRMIKHLVLIDQFIQISRNSLISTTTVLTAMDYLLLNKLALLVYTKLSLLGLRSILF